MNIKRLRQISSTGKSSLKTRLAFLESSPSVNRQKAESAQWSGIINAANARRNVWLARWQERIQELEQDRPAYELPEELPSRIPQLHEWSSLVHEVLEDDSDLMELDAEDIEMKVRPLLFSYRIRETHDPGSRST